MAETTGTTTVEKHYCYDCPSSYGSNDALLASVLNNQNNANNPMTAALMANGGLGQNQMWNNPMMYLVWMWMMRWMNGNGWGNGENAEGLNWNNRSLAQIQSSIDNNHNADLTMDAIKGNGAAIHELASNFNTDFNTMSQAICSVKSAIEQVGANVGFSAERVINAVNQGDCGIINAVQTTSCATQKAILEQGYQNQLQSERQTGILGSKIDSNHADDQLQRCQNNGAILGRIDTLANGIQQGFAQIGYQMATDKSDMIQAGNANTQRIMDLLNNHWTAELSQQLQDEKFKNSQLQQNQYLAGLINGSCSCSGN